MELQNFKKLLIRNFKKKNFFISDGNEKIYGYQIEKIINKKLQIIKKFNLKGNTIAILKNRCGSVYWVNLMIAYMLDFTIYPEINTSDIKKLYKNVIVFNGDEIKVEINKTKKNPKLKNYNIIFSSSGSTGEPKLILQNMASLLKNTKSVLETINFKRNKVFMMCIPYLYTSAICHFFACVMSCTNFIAIEKTILPSDLKKNILKKKVNYFGGPPLHSKWIIDFINNKFVFFEKLLSSGDFLSHNTIDKFIKKKINYNFFYMYGISEVGGRLCINKIKKNKFKYSVGKSLKYMKIINKEKKEDEIIIKSNNLYYGYYTKSKFIIQKGKYYKSGDIGIIDNGNLFLSGRTSEIFKSSGVMVYPQLIYDELIKTKWFEDILIFKGNIETFGNVPFCVFSSKRKIKEDRITKYLKKKLPTEQIPKKILQIKKFPRLGNNKIDKQSVINRFN